MLSLRNPLWYTDSMSYTIQEGKIQYLNFTMSYASDWTPSEKASQPVPTADTADVFFIVKRNDSDADPILSLSVGDGTIVWNSSTTGSITVQIDETTLGKSGNYQYELALKLIAGDYVSVEKGILTIEKSIAGNP